MGLSKRNKEGDDVTPRFVVDGPALGLLVEGTGGSTRSASPSFTFTSSQTFSVTKSNM